MAFDDKTDVLEEVCSKWTLHIEELLNSLMLSTRPFEYSNEELLHFFIERSKNWNRQDYICPHFCTLYTNEGTATSEYEYLDQDSSWNTKRYELIQFKPYFYNNFWKWSCNILSSSFKYGMSLYNGVDKCEYDKYGKQYFCTVDNKKVDPNSYFNDEKNKERMYLIAYSFKTVTLYNSIKQCYRIYSLPSTDDNWNTIRIAVAKSQCLFLKYFLENPFEIMDMNATSLLELSNTIYRDRFEDCKKYYYDKVFSSFIPSINSTIKTIQQQVNCFLNKNKMIDLHEII